jgi:hypothetical protein
MATIRASITMLFEGHAPPYQRHTTAEPSGQSTVPPWKCCADRRFHRHPSRSPNKHSDDRRVLVDFLRLLRSSITRPIQPMISRRHRREFDGEMRGGTIGSSTPMPPNSSVVLTRTTRRTGGPNTDDAMITHRPTQ